MTAKLPPDSEPGLDQVLARSRQGDLLARWEADESALRRRGAASQADVLAGCIGELRADLEAHRLETLSLHDAAREAGMTYKGLQKAVAAGRVRNAGTPNRPRVRRGDLPRKARASQGPDLVGTALGLVPDAPSSLTS